MATWQNDFSSIFMLNLEEEGIHVLFRLEGGSEAPLLFGIDVELFRNRDFIYSAHQLQEDFIEQK